MQCALSGESPQVPAVSSKSGNVFEKRLIEAYISENGKDPINGEEMTVDDLIDLKTDRTVRPRPPTFTSIPSLLSAFQNEWDALVLDSYNVRQQLSQTRQELATALYQHDAAIRVITRLTKERDEARDALSKVTVGAGSGEAMQVDNAGLPEELAAKVDATQEELSKSRRKRPVPKDWATAEAIETYKAISQSEALYSGSQTLAVDQTGDLAIVGGSDGVAGVYSISKGKVTNALKVGGSVLDAVFYGKQPIVASSSGAVKVFAGKKEAASFTSHAGAATGLAMHPCGDILASVGVDKSFVFYDLVSGTSVSQVFTESSLSAAAFHPDGHLFAAGGADGQVKLYHTKSGEFAASFDCGAPIQDISFSENGIWFAVALEGSTNVSVFDLRKEGQPAIKVIDTGSRVDLARWDYSGQFLATAGPAGVTVQQYAKSSKAWSEPLRSAVPATALAWGPSASSLLLVSEDGVVTVLGA